MKLSVVMFYEKIKEWLRYKLAKQKRIRREEFLRRRGFCDLDPEARRVLNENRWDLYEESVWKHENKRRDTRTR